MARERRIPTIRLPAIAPPMLPMPPMTMTAKLYTMMSVPIPGLAV